MTPFRPSADRSRVRWLAVIGALALPALLGGVLVSALDDPTARLGNMTAAIVNDDDGTEIDGQTVPLGRQLAAGLVEGSDDLDSNLDWVLSNEDDAEEGLADGTYQAVVTIPAEFSAAAMSSAQSLSGEDEKPEQALIEVTTAPDARVVDGAITSEIAAVAASTLGTTLSESTLENVFVGYTTLGDQLGEAADGAHALADGATQAQDGATQLADGATQAQDGAMQLANGADQAQDGAVQLANGAGAARDGATQLADGAGAAQTGATQLADGATQVADGIGQLGTGAGDLANGADQLATGATDASAGATRLADGAGALADGATQLAAGIRQAQDGAAQMQTQLSDGAAALTASGLVPDDLLAAASGAAQATTGVSDGLDALVAGCAASGAAAEYCAQLSAIAGAADQAEQAAAGTSGGLSAFDAQATAQIAGQLQEAAGGAGALAGDEGLGALATGADELASGASELQTGTGALADGVAQLAGGATQLGDGARQLQGGAAPLADGATQLATGATDLSGGIGQLADGATDLSDGIAQLATGAADLGSGIGQLEDGATDLGGGIGQLADGATDLGDGIGELGSGATTLGDGLDQATEALPSYTDEEAADLASAVADPVASSASDLELFGASAIPLLIAAVLWFGGLATFLALRPIAGRTLTSRRASVLLAGGGLLPAASIGAAQGVLVAGVVQLAAGYEASTFWALLGLSALAGVAFAAVHQALVTILGGAGRWIAAVAGTLAIATGIVSTTPGVLGDLAAALPTAPAHRALLAVISDAPGAGAAIAGLVVWAVLAFAATSIAVAAQRTVSARALLAS
ncbi:YhgE/Pip family protein [Microbacterium sp. JZ101]